MIVLGYSGFTRDSHRSMGGWNPYALTRLGFEHILSFREGEVPFNLFPLGYFGHDASAAIVVDGEVIACASEERFTRAKYSLNLAGNTLLPANAIKFCLNRAGVSPNQVDTIAHYCSFTEESVRQRFVQVSSQLNGRDADRVNDAYDRTYRVMLQPDVVKSQLATLTGDRTRNPIPVPHHLAHAASSYYVSGFEEAVILTLDGAGEVESSLLAIGRGREITELERTYLPASLGAVYMIITNFLGFHSLGDEYKVMGLASYGNPDRFRHFFEALIHLGDDGRYTMPDFAREDLTERIVRDLGHPRSHGEPIEDRHANIAASLQEAIERPVVSLLGHVRSETGIPCLCLAGGVALNCAMNGAIARSRIFDDIFVQPAASDEGCSLGAALYAYHMSTAAPYKPARWDHSLYGPDYSEKEMAEALAGFDRQVTWSREESIARKVAEEVSRGAVIGWFQGRMEFGPRALGNRSIVADPRRPEMKDLINNKVKRREPFRPFAPAILEDEAPDFFDMDGLGRSPFMLFTFPVREDRRDKIPAVTHVDGTARVQTVSRDANGPFYDLIESFRRLTGVPVLLNTSFNVRNEPIVCSPQDAIRCFLSTDIDALAMGNFYVEKRAS